MNHLAFFVSDLIDQLDLSDITSVYEGEDRGYPPYHPVMLMKVVVYGYCVGGFSSRRIQRRLVEDVAFRVLAAGNEPDFRTIADFRKRHLPVLQGFFEQVLQLAQWSLVCTTHNILKLWRGARAGRLCSHRRAWRQTSCARSTRQCDRDSDYSDGLLGCITTAAAHTRN